MPEVFYVECGAVLRRWDLNGVLASAEVATAIEELMTWPLRVTQVGGLFADAWRHHSNITCAGAIYVALAEHLGAPRLTDDHRLANTPNLPVHTLRLI